MRLTMGVLVLAAAGCGDGNHAATTDLAAPPDLGPVAVAPGPTRGSAVAVTPDDSIAVVANRDVGSVTILQLAFLEGGAPSATR